MTFSTNYFYSEQKDLFIRMEEDPIIIENDSLKIETPDSYKLGRYHQMSDWFTFYDFQHQAEMLYAKIKEMLALNIENRKKHWIEFDEYKPETGETVRNTIIANCIYTPMAARLSNIWALMSILVRSMQRRHNLFGDMFSDDNISVAPTRRRVRYQFTVAVNRILSPDYIPKSKFVYGIDDPNNVFLLRRVYLVRDERNQRQLAQQSVDESEQQTIIPNYNPNAPQSQDLAIISTQTSVQVCSSTSSHSQQKKKQKLDLSPDISANTSQLTISGDISQTLSLFECCVCLEYINPPILQCRNSHVFCKPCRQNFKSPLKCPTCRDTIPRKDNRNYSLEQIADSLRLQFPCKYKTNGCDVTSLLTDISKHEDLCQHKPFKCPDVLGECEWSGSKEEVTQHLMDEHNYRRIDSRIFNKRIKLNDKRAKLCDNFWAIILYYKNQNFVIITKLENIHKCYSIIVLFIGEQIIADQFKYKIKVFNDNNDNKLQCIEKPISIRRDVESLLSFNNNEGLTLDNKMIDKLSFDHTFKLKITIKSENNE